MDRPHIEREAKRPGQGELKEKPNVPIGGGEEAENDQEAENDRAAARQEDPQI